MTSDLPSPKPSQAYVHASVLEGGHLNLEKMTVIQGTKSSTIPVMAFLLRHSQSDKKIVFDLGLRKDWPNLPPSVQELLTKHMNPDVPIDVVDSLRRGGLEVDDIDVVILSHIHFDHVGNPDLFPASHFIVGGGSKALLADGYTVKDAEPALNPHYAKNLLPESRTTFLSSDDWTPIGPFPRAHDFFGDGSVYLVDAPGHLAGHLNLLARTSAEGSWLYLGGDSAHDMQVLTGENEIPVYPDPYTGKLVCMHADIGFAKEHISRIRCLLENPRVTIVVAHDLEWYRKNKDVIFPGKIRAT